MNWFYRVNGQVITRVVSRRVCVCVYWRLRRPPTFLPSSTKEFVRYTILSDIQFFQIMDQIRNHRSDIAIKTPPQGPCSRVSRRASPCRARRV